MSSEADNESTHAPMRWEFASYMFNGERKTLPFPKGEAEERGILNLLATIIDLDTLQEVLGHVLKCTVCGQEISHPITTTANPTYLPTRKEGEFAIETRTFSCTNCGNILSFFPDRLQEIRDSLGITPVKISDEPPAEPYSLPGQDATPPPPQAPTQQPATQQPATPPPTGQAPTQPPKPFLEKAFQGLLKTLGLHKGDRKGDQKGNDTGARK
ncbi:hypothetical protein [Oecophyllibacter saccharovorans]|uniref:hypothetical protein n=1 Tax=Oecophyllibacter saccharovorans TaxID=2558360 RepID=UPI0011710E85|nr:hypothetical protein [Oecophyllibacter saccharovorans]TPW36611.1 hypothetical protein E3203_02275 [Oecophyllibacter saccharovorans]